MVCFIVDNTSLLAEHKNLTARLQDLRSMKARGMRICSQLIGL